MTDLKKLLLIPMIAGSLLLTGCGGGDHDDHEDHDHEGHGHEEHSEGGAQDKEGGDEHGTEHAMGQVEIAGTVLKVEVPSDVKPNAKLHLHLEVVSGPTPAAIRVWIGNESATGSIKGKASGSDGGYHADATCPAELSDSDALWIEIESADGSRAEKSLPLEHHDE